MHFIANRCAQCVALSHPTVNKWDPFQRGGATWLWCCQKGWQRPVDQFSSSLSSCLHWGVCAEWLHLTQSVHCDFQLCDPHFFFSPLSCPAQTCHVICKQEAPPDPRIHIFCFCEISNRSLTWMERLLSSALSLSRHIFNVFLLLFRLCISLPHDTAIYFGQ